MKRLLSLALSAVLLLSCAAPALAADHDHRYDENGVCTVCGESCPHSVYLNGVCAACGQPCPHPAWAEGRCVRCHILCGHPEHDRDTKLCTTCGEYVEHTYVGGSCPRCGRWPALQSDPLPQWLFAPCAEKGSVQTLSYTTHDYVKERTEGGSFLRNKKLCVYLPYGYDSSEPYDVLILVHGMGDNERYWLLREQEYYEPTDAHVYTTDLLDNMMAARLSRRMIVVTPTFYRNSDNVWDYNRYEDQDQFVLELRKDILPLIVRTYSTYASEPTAEAISRVREHFAYAGLSMGSIYAYNAVLPLCLDLFAWYGCFSGAETYVRLTSDALNSANWADYPIRFFYNSCGVNDGMHDNHLSQFKQMVERCPGLTESVNATFTDILRAGHTYQAWGVGLYNFLLLLFQQEESPAPGP